MRKILGFFDRSVWMFILIGLGNTLLSTLIMQGLNIMWGGGYWLPSAIAFALTSIMSYFLNRRFAFQSDTPIKQTAWKFALVVAVFYALAYGAARPAMHWILSRIWPGLNILWIDRIAMLAGQVIYNVMNYLGQRFFTFR